MSINWPWADFWANLRIAPMEQRIAIGNELDNVPGGFVGWVKSRSPKTQIEVMENAPDWVQRNIYSEGALKPLAAVALDIEPNAMVVDKRSRK